MSLDDFRTEFAPNGAVDRTKLNFFTHLKDNEEEKILIYYAEEKNVGIKGMRQFIGLLEERNIQRGIMIWSEKMTSAARKVSWMGEVYMQALGRNMADLLSRL